MQSCIKWRTEKMLLLHFIIIIFFLSVVFSVITQLILPIRPSMLLGACATLSCQQQQRLTWNRPLKFTPTPPFSLLRRAWGRKDGRLRGRKTSIRTQRMTGRSPLLLRQPPHAEHGGLCLPQSSYVPAGGSTHTFNKRASPRAHLPGFVSACVCMSRHLMGVCVAVCVCEGGCKWGKQRGG